MCRQGILYSLRNMYTIESQSDPRPSAASLIETKRPQTESLILSGEEKHSPGRREQTGLTLLSLRSKYFKTWRRLARRSGNINTSGRPSPRRPRALSDGSHEGHDTHTHTDGYLQGSTHTALVVFHRDIGLVPPRVCVDRSAERTF